MSGRTEGTPPEADFPPSRARASSGRVPGPSRAELEAARSKVVPDLLAEDLDVLFCGINPGLVSGALGHHFANPGTRFWPALHRSGFTPRRLRPDEEDVLLSLGLGITNVVARTTAQADELSREEIVEGGRTLRRKVLLWRPRWLAVLGVTAYRQAFGDRGAKVGHQAMEIGGTRVWLLPNPSGRNAHWQPGPLAEEFARLRVAAGLPDHSPAT
ncbi:TDG/mug DNA glycosylase family protein [Nocardiopsis arvandica]|uniref:TDG/mug DNA glycosylase family protein n=1 Tax=Nocardiopsis sinuspersici TaxID=501010 RepID=A0A7Y9XHJ5_9ACTN|nr:TDG/mug DNA glycosylase family protein [Nocardiopsis sinuspersici]